MTDTSQDAVDQSADVPDPEVSVVFPSHDAKVPGPGDSHGPDADVPDADAAPGSDAWHMEDARDRAGADAKDAVGPADAAGPGDLAEVAQGDESNPDPTDVSASDMGLVDAGACGQCPFSAPNCIAGKCVCTGTSCPTAEYCKGGQCVPCNADAHCGPECESCSSNGQYCADDAAGCVECNAAHPCGTGIQCLDGICSGCSNSDPAHCGKDCIICTGAAPHCKDGACTLCAADDSCADSCAPCQAPTPHCLPSGAACVACLDTSQCPPDHTCEENGCKPNCAAQGCATDLSEGGKKCKDPFIVGRLDAAVGKSFAGDTENASDDDDLNYFMEHLECWDASSDNFYRIYLMPGDALSVTLKPQVDAWNAMLKIYNGTECDDDDAGIFSKNDKYLIKCFDSKDSGVPVSFNHVAATEGWYTVVVDGKLSGFEEEDYGPYTLDIKLTCADAGCCCP